MKFRLTQQYESPELMCPTWGYHNGHYFLVPPVTQHHGAMSAKVLIDPRTGRPLINKGAIHRDEGVFFPMDLLPKFLNFVLPSLPMLDMHPKGRQVIEATSVFASDDSTPEIRAYCGYRGAGLFLYCSFVTGTYKYSGTFH